MKTIRILIAIGLASVAFVGLKTVQPAAASGTGHHVMQRAMLVGTSNLPQQVNVVTSHLGNETYVQPERSVKHNVSGSARQAAFPAPPTPAGDLVTSSNPGWFGFDALNHFQQRNSGTGIYTNTNFSLEPPDQGLCAGNGYVLEGVNTALSVYSTSGQLISGPNSINQFFGVTPAINRSTGVRGDFMSDPKCYFDSQINRWFITVLDEVTGGRSFTYIAVSKTSMPFGNYAIFAIDATDDGNASTPLEPNCPCFGDQPLIGADRYGFYVTTNEFPRVGSGFNGAQIYAVSKTQLALAANSGASPAVAHFYGFTLPDLVGNPQLSYTVQPAQSPTAIDMATQEYFLSALQFGSEGSSTDNRIAFWTMVGASTINNPTPSLNLMLQVLPSETYGQPPLMRQMDGPRPLGASYEAANPTINSNDDRMNQVYYAHGLLYSGVNTIALSSTAAPEAAIAYFVVNPNGGTFPFMASQGYVAVDNQDVAFPSIGVNTNGGAIMVFSLMGPSYFPSSAYAKINVGAGPGPVHIAGAGQLPEDGFTCYPAYGGPPCRWGDYSAAVVDQLGNVWMASEYIPNDTRTVLANWGTFISRVTPNATS